MEATRYQCWWYSDLLGWRCDGYPTPGQAEARLEEVREREHFTRGLAVDMEEHLTGQEDYPTQKEFERRHENWTEYVTNV